MTIAQHSLSDNNGLRLTKHNGWVALSVLLLWAALFYPEISGTVDIWLTSDTYAHGLFILPLTLWLMWRRREAFMAIQARTSYVAAVCCIGISALWFIAQLMEIHSLIHLFTFMMLSCMLWLFLGDEFAKVFKFPLAYVLFCAPFGNSLIPYLQVITAELTVFFLQLSQIPVFYEGLYITVPGGVFEVAVACSGIRYLIACLAIGSIYAHLSYQKLYKQLTFIAFAIIFPIIANGIRAYLIVIIAYLSDMKYATGVDHLVYGWLFFGLVIYLLFYIGGFWADKTNSESSTGVNPAAHHPSNKRRMTLAIVMVVLLTVVIKSHGFVVASVPSTTQSLSLSLEQHSLQPQHKTWGVNFKHSQGIYQATSMQGVEVYVAQYAHRQQVGKLITSINRLYEIEYWSIVSQQQKTKQVAGKLIQFNQIELVNSNGQRLVMRYWYSIAGDSFASRIEAKVAQALGLSFNTSQYGYFQSIATAVASDDNSGDDAHQKLEQWMDSYLIQLAAQLP